MAIKKSELYSSLWASYVNSYIQNRQHPSLEVLFQILRILDVNPQDFINSKRNGI